MSKEITEEEEQKIKQEIDELVRSSRIASE